MAMGSEEEKKKRREEKEEGIQTEKAKHAYASTNRKQKEKTTSKNLLIKQNELWNIAKIDPQCRKISKINYLF